MKRIFLCKFQTNFMKHILLFWQRCFNWDKFDVTLCEDEVFLWWGWGYVRALLCEDESLWGLSYVFKKVTHKSLSVLYGICFVLYGICFTSVLSLLFLCWFFIQLKLHSYCIFFHGITFTLFQFGILFFNYTSIFFWLYIAYEKQTLLQWLMLMIHVKKTVCFLESTLFFLTVIHKWYCPQVNICRKFNMLKYPWSG